ncbi:Hypothetical predicted protein [Mytilus galloprovincialis]|uniref:Peptidase A2 domain-containing protein n=1 Tax=Mytilus galloprovincialis TaxID=29158 RepID=A0A8B6G0K4_MYTGA|nr:Hypothetical predicted protein [Mytilus galloprovincialis]
MCRDEHENGQNEMSMKMARTFILLMLMNQKFEEIKGYRMLQKKIIQSKELKWTEVVRKFYDGNDEEAENTLHPYLGMSQSSEFDNYIKNMTDCQDGDGNTLSDKQYKFLAVKELRAADFIFLAEEAVKEETIRKIHAKNIERSIPKYTIASFTQLNKETEKVADYCYGKIAINVQQKKGSESHFTDLQEMHVAQFVVKSESQYFGMLESGYFLMLASRHFGMPASRHSGMPASRHFWIPASGYFGMPASRHFGMPASRHSGMPASRHFGMPGSRYLGMPASGYFGMPASRHFGMPASRHSGMTSSRHFGMPASRYLGMPASGYFGMPASRYLGMPASGYLGMPASRHFGMPASRYFAMQASGYFGMPASGYFGMPASRLYWDASIRIFWDASIQICWDVSFLENSLLQGLFRTEEPILKPVFKIEKKSRQDGIYIDGIINDVPTIFTVDIGAAITVLSEELYLKIHEEVRPPLVQSHSLIGADGNSLRELGTADFGVRLGNFSFDMELVVSHIPDSVLLGLDILVMGKKGPVQIRLADQVLYWNEQNIPF